MVNSSRSGSVGVMIKRKDIIKYLKEFVADEYMDINKYGDFLFDIENSEIEKDEKRIIKTVIKLIRVEEFDHAEAIHKLIEKINGMSSLSNN